MTALVRCLNGIQTFEKTWPFLLVKKGFGRPSFKAPQSGCSQGAPLSQNTRRKLECINTDCFSDAAKSKRQIEIAFTRIGMASIFVSLLTFRSFVQELELCKSNSRAGALSNHNRLFVLILKNYILTVTAFTGLVEMRTAQ